MGLSATQRRALSRKAVDNSLEVEDLLKVAAIGDMADATFLRGLKVQHEWPDTGQAGRSLVVPLGRWAETVCRFLEEGYAGLVGMPREIAGAAPFCIAVLEEVRTPESASAMLAIGGALIEQPAIDVGLAVRIAAGFNNLLSFSNAPVVAPAVEHQIREFLHRLLSIELTEDQRATAVCALRGVGDAASASLVAALPPFKGSWAGLEASAARQIKKRVLRVVAGQT